jgi:hypothetical protein
MGKASSRKSLSRRVPSTSSRRRTGPSRFTLVVAGIIIVGVFGVLVSRDDDSGVSGAPDVAPTASTVAGETTTTVAGETTTTVAGETTTTAAGETTTTAADETTTTVDEGSDTTAVGSSGATTTTDAG